jgi:outer membrane protein TolC
MSTKQKFQVLFLFVIFSMLVPAEAQENTSEFSLKEALDYASENAYLKKSSNYDVESAKKKIWETIASGLPQVDFSARYNHSIDMAKSLLPIEFFPEENWPSGAQEGDKIAVAFGTAYDANYNIGVSQLIFDGSYFVGVQATRVFYDYTEQNQRKTEIEIRNSVAQAYFLVLSAQENKEAFADLLKANEDLLQETKAMNQSGFVEAMDVSQMELLVNDSRKRLMEVTRNEEVAMAVLKFTLGMDAYNQLNLTDSLSFLTQRIISGGMPVELFVPDSHVDYQLALTNEESQRLYLKNERVQYLPRISAFYNFQQMGYSDQWNVFNEDWYKAQFVGLQISMPIFSSGMRNAKVQQQKLSYKKSQNEREMALHSLQTSFITAQTNMKSSYEQYLYSIDNKNLAHDILEKTRIKFSHGVASSSEYTQHQSQYIQSHLSYVQSAVNLMNSHIALLKATGQL